MDINKKIEIYKNKTARLKIRLSGKKNFQRIIIKALVVTARGDIQVHDMLESGKYSGFAYQINEVWREINPESRLTYQGHSAYIYIGNCMLPLVFDAKAFNPVMSGLIKKLTVDADGNELTDEAKQGVKLESSGYYFVDPVNFERIMNVRLIGELTTKENDIRKVVNWILIVVVIFGIIYLVAKGFGIDLLSGVGGQAVTP